MDMEETLIEKSLFAFTRDFYAALLKAQDVSSPTNLFVSPTSIWIAMLMTEAGSEGATKKEMVDTLRLPPQLPDEKVHNVTGETLMGCFQSVPGVELSLANRLFILKTAKIRDRFTKLLQECYKCCAEELDSLGSSEAKRVHMNEWVCENTKGKIENLLAPGTIRDDTVITIINTLYFRGLWAQKFAKESTSEAQFHKLDGSVQTIKMMQVEHQYPYVDMEDIDAKALKIPFKQDEWAMVLVLPNRNDGLPALLEYLQIPGKIETITSENFNERDVFLFLPRFKLGEGSAVNAMEILQSLGMKSVFEAGSADLTGLCEQPRLFVSNVLHKAILEVDEEGATAAASTGVAMMTRCRPRPYEKLVFRVDHPFFVAIFYNNTIPVFLGHVSVPETF
ncbi:unnamed protein product [Calicophoron daubneyi]|uniref:Serpin domain-containing protein n=1 Tax=Calicophoron daubneyi TaxID=300641 RepID=A0AAV2TYT4_CALDB